LLRRLVRCLPALMALVEDADDAASRAAVSALLPFCSLPDFHAAIVAQQHQGLLPALLSPRPQV
jgi:hypothetical protein